MGPSSHGARGGTLAAMGFDPRIGERFMLRGRRLTQAFEEGGAYRVHYLEAPGGGIPLSIERA